MPTYEYEILGPDGAPTGERFEAFQSIREDALAAAPDGRPCRRAIVMPAVVRVKKARPRDRYKPEGHGVWNPHLPNPQASEMRPYDSREGSVVGSLREHPDGTVSTYAPGTSHDKRPVIRNDSDRKRWDDRERAVHGRATFDPQPAKAPPKKPTQRRTRRATPRNA